MLSWLKFQIALSQLRREQRRIDAAYVKAIRAVKAQGGDKEAIAAISFDEYETSHFVDERIRLLNTRYLFSEADRYL
jgi:hypothetical protein